MPRRAARSGRSIRRVHNNGNVIRLRNRGVAYWKGAEGERIFHFVRDRAYAIDARTGALDHVVRQGRVHRSAREPRRRSGDASCIEMTSPGAVFENLLILGSRVNESYDASPGHIRAFDTVTGQLRWIFHTIPQAGEFGHDTWQWSKGETSAAPTRGAASPSTSSAAGCSPRPARRPRISTAASAKARTSSRTASSRSTRATGQRKWHYQTVRHDIWDYDNPPAPILVTIRHRHHQPRTPSSSSRRWG